MKVSASERCASFLDFVTRIFLILLLLSQEL